MSQHSARLHALTAALCALLLLVALCVMALEHAPWWALCGVQGAVLVTTASAGMWLDRCTGGERRRGDEATRTPPRLPGWAQGDAMPQDGWSQEMWQRHGLPGVLRVTDADAVFWQERAIGEEEDHRR